jgi:hypothetical protein
MRSSRIVAALLGMGVAATALADPVWSRPGWYQVEDVSDGSEFLYQGPFDDKQSCEANMPADDIVDHFHCEHLQAQPAYDLDN